MAATTTPINPPESYPFGNDEEESCSFYCDTSSSPLSISSGDSNDDGDDEKKRLQDPKENRVITILRVALIAVLIMSGILVSTSLYMYVNKHNQSNALERSEDQMEAIARGFSYKVSRVVQELDRLAVELRVLARYNNNNNNNNGGGSPWPYVVFPDFEQMASKTRKAANLDAVAFLPLVNTEDGGSSGGGGIVNNKVVAWSKYAAEHLQDWLSVSLSFLGDEATGEERESGTDDKNVFTNFPTTTTNNGSVGLPLWQLSPPVPQTSVYGEDLLGNASSKEREDSARVTRVLEQVLASGNAVVGESIHVAPWEQQPSSKKSEGSFFGTIGYPIILDGLDDITTNRQIVGVLLATVPWHALLHDVAEEQRMGHSEDDDDTATNFVCVLENEYNQTMNYLLNPTATTSETMPYGTVPVGGPVGIVSDLIDDTQKILADSEESVVALGGDHYHYKLQIYRTAGARPADGYAAAYAVVAGLVFFFTTMLFLTYDIVVQRRQKDILKAAVRSTQLVSSLFPAQVRDRLLQQHKGPASDAGDKNDDSEAPYDLPAMNEMEKGNDQGNNKAATVSASAVPSKIDNKGGHGGDHLDKPIADLYPNCTVLFSDICGFTAWSSERSPTQVFTLLQNIFHAFDKVARKRGVYKVETIGDSYVAVTGLPDPQSNHAVIMAAFALECQARLRDVTRNLERKLGPGTSILSMRFGIHSGPVTAGVLIGERARFQLFGDTVNTAARMESTGRKDAVQVSESTANLLIEAGKSHWVTQREDLVQVKGKGEMRTYWLESRGARTAVGSCHSFRGGFDSTLHVCEENSITADMLTEEEGIPAGEDESAAVVSSESQNPPTRGMLRAQGGEVWGTSDIFGSTPPALERRRSSDPLSRLIDWNVDLLTDLLKKVIAQRMSQSEGGTGETPFIPPSITGHTIDEVTEIIELPGFDPSKCGSKQVDPQTVEIDNDVVDQLQEYVTMIASMYRDNPFHNYEHACHVQQSMTKLLQHIASSESESSAGGDSQSQDLDNYTYGITSDPLTQFACIFSALIHDVDHYGVSNGQLVKEQSPIASVYNNMSVAEQNSVDLAWELLMDKKYDDLRQCIFTNEIEYEKFRHLVVNVVLATDIFDPKLSELRKKRWRAAFTEETPAEAESDRANRKATIVIEHLIQASDVSHTMQHWEIYRKWNERLFFEMYSAFQTGRMEKDPSTFWYQGELGFFDNYIIPLARKLQQCHVFGVSSDECLNYALENRRIWADKGQQIVAEMVTTDFFAKPKSRRSRRQARKTAALSCIDA